MKATIRTVLAALAAQRAAAHAIFQQMWVDGVDMGSQCARVPMSNTPVTNLNSNDLRCNVGGMRGAASKCAVKAGGVVTVEMHQQPGDRSCGHEAIGGAHYGPVMVYLSKVPNALSADASTPFFKIFQNGWSATGGVGDNDAWGVKDMNACCGKVDVKIPASLPDGDYLLRAEVVALHAQPAQLYMTCYQLTVSGGGNGTLPTGVRFPGAYKSSDQGIAANIHAKLSTYIVPGPSVIPGGTDVKAGTGCAAGCAKSCSVGKGPTSVLSVEAPAETAASGTTPGGGVLTGCAKKAWEQCGGTGYTGCTSCDSGLRCNQNNQYYHQCTT